MNGSFERVELGGGGGLIAVVGKISLFVTDGEAAGRLVDITRESANAGSPPGRTLARRLAAHLIGEEADGVPDFGAIAAVDAGWILLLHGDVAASFVAGDGTEQHVSGADSVTWLDRILPAGIGSVFIAPVGTAQPASSPASLEAGVVLGGWLRVTLSTSDGASATGVRDDVEVVPTPETLGSMPDDGAVTATLGRFTTTGKTTVIPPPPAGDHTSAMATGPGEAATNLRAERDLPTGEVELFSLMPAGGDRRSALPIEGVTGVADTAVTQDAEPDHVVLTGHEVLASDRPSLGIIVFDDGSTYGLDGDYVVGREPDIDASVVEGHARPILLDDPDGTVSRVHAEIRLVDGDVQLIDRGSTNGTHVWDTVKGAWDTVVAGGPRAILPGDRAAFGHRTFTFERPAGPATGAAAAPRSAQTIFVGNVAGELVGVGGVYPLDRSYVIGRDPMVDDAVRQGSAYPIAVSDAEVAGVHARISVVAGLVHVRDAGTSAGTFVAAPGTNVWDPVGPDPVELRPGWSICVGHQVLTFRSATS